MRKIIVGAFVSLDGIMQAPGGPHEDPVGGFDHGGWAAPYFDETMGQAVDEMFSKPFDLLLGRKTGLSGILCGGPVSSVEEPLAKDDGELCLCLDPFPRRPFPLLGRVVKNEI
ncbi:hypothetical protein ACVMB2_002177 [Sinorhizobium meliloti]